MTSDPPPTAPRPAASEALRHVALPVYYVTLVSALLGAATARAAHPALADAAAAGAVSAGAGALFALERAGARRFSRTTPGGAGRYLAAQHGALTREHTWRYRAALLAQAVACWLVAGAAALVAAHALGSLLHERSASLRAASRALATWPEAARVLAAFVALDAWSYLRHRLEHARGERGPLWRWVHRRHHAPAAMNLWTGMVVHPAEAALVFGLPTVAMGALGYARWEAALLFALFLAFTMPQHMNSGWTAGALSAWIHGPEAHTAHHADDFATRNANYADCLTLWDRLFGTYRAAPRAVFCGPFGPGSPRAYVPIESRAGAAK